MATFEELKDLYLQVFELKKNYRGELEEIVVDIYGEVLSELGLAREVVGPLALGVVSEEKFAQTAAKHLPQNELYIEFALRLSLPDLTDSGIPSSFVIEWSLRDKGEDFELGPKGGRAQDFGTLPSAARFIVEAFKRKIMDHAPYEF